ncbi:putative ABC transporter ATP-binding protein YxlF [Microcoleus sp. IPMA8]|uniref:ABC transporter ATP-binding protein YxlF n=1 Tax=Microcoleus asticus IPMA8 TaxID=2563858 RepID=A0ABX2CX95_9CYAN|nr:putative ABC transporter ATP-binding protein YxlF [Microcoleus asticus IPMA8]
MIEVEHLSKTYGSTAAIADVSFSVESGEILGFLGPNGAGKTTTMRILSGYLPASSGTARIAGLDVHENSMAVRQRIGYLPENPPLYPEMTVEGFLFFVARIKQVPAGDRARRVTSAIERCGLVDKRKVLIRKLSKGFRQRVGIAQAIVHDPPVIILDEPTVGLDPRQIIEVRNLIKSLGGQHTIILSTHILPEVSMTCNRVTIINRGKIVAAGTPENLMGELAAGEGYELEVEGEADLVNSLLLPSLENVPGVRSVELIPSQQFLASRYRLRALCESDIEPGREIAAAIITSGFGLCEMRRNRASLEDVFLRLTAAEKKPEENLVHSEPEVDRNLQEAAETQDSIADSHQSESQPIVENLIVSDRQESIEHPQPESEPVVETLESIEHPQPETIVENLEVVETVESIEHPQPEPIVENLPVVSETVESIEHHVPESEPIAETEEISDLEPEMQPVADFLETVERQELIENPQPEPIVENLLSVERQESIENPQPEPIVENLLIVERQESIEPHQPEPVVETVESIEPHQPEPVVENLEVSETVKSSQPSQPESVVENLLIVETVELSQPSQPESVVENLLIVETVELSQPSQPEPVVENLLIVETPESSQPSQPESQPVVKNRQLKKKPQPSSDSQPEQPPVTKKRQIERKQQNSDDSETPPAGDSK